MSKNRVPKNSAKPVLKYVCEGCGRRGFEEDFEMKLLSIQWRPKNDNIQAFFQVKCPKCKILITIVFETLENKK